MKAKIVGAIIAVAVAAAGVYCGNVPELMRGKEK